MSRPRLSPPPTKPGPIMAPKKRLLHEPGDFPIGEQGYERGRERERSTLIPFLCKCADFDLPRPARGTIAEFEAAHSRDDHYFILPGHQRAEGEEILSENGRYEIVSKALHDKVSRRARFPYEAGGSAIR